MASAQPDAAAGTVEPDPFLEMQNGGGSAVKVNITWGKRQGFADPAAEVEQQPDKKPIPQALSGFFQFLYFCWLKVRLSHKPYPKLPDLKTTVVETVYSTLNEPNPAQS